MSSKVAILTGLFVLPSLCQVALADGALTACDPMPKAIRIEEPYFPNVEPRGLPTPISILLEFTIHPDGSVGDVIVIRREAPSMSELLGRTIDDEARSAMARSRFERGATPCRGRMRLVVKDGTRAHEVGTK